MRIMRKSFSKKIAYILLLAMVGTALSACTQKGKEEPYTSPNFQNPDDKVDASGGDAVKDVDELMGKATNGDAVFDNSKVNTASIGDAEAVFGDRVNMVSGFTENNTYYNYLMDIKISTNGDSWRIYDAEKVAEVTGVEQEDIEAFWNGSRSPYDQEISYCAIVHNYTTASNIIISYFNPSSYRIVDMSPESYLEITKKQYEGAELSNVEFMGQTYALLDIPANEDRGRQLQYVIEKDELYFIITVTLKEEMALEDVMGIIGKAY